MNPKHHLHRSRTNRIIAGVCGGVAEHWSVDPTLVRILALVLPGISWVTYLVCAIIIPEE